MRATPLLLRFLGAALIAVTLALPAAASNEKVGVNAAVNTDATGTQPGGVARKLVVGEDVVHNERVTTDVQGQTQLLFVDGSSISIGPSADLVIDEFVYDPQSGAGKMTLTALQGAMRFVGGKLSKQDNAVSVQMGTATIGVRGGIFVADFHHDGTSTVAFVFGKAVTITGKNGTEVLYRPGFGVEIDVSGHVGSPHPLPPGVLAGILAHLDGRFGSHGGAPRIPNDQYVANSGVPNTVSNNVQGSEYQADNNSTFSPPPPSNPNPPQVSSSQTQIVQSQGQPGLNSQPPTVVTIAGGFKDAFTDERGFVNTRRTNNQARPYTGTITYPANAPQTGTLNGSESSGFGSGSSGLSHGSASAGSDFTFTLSPLTPGQTTNVTATAFDNGVPTGDTASGPATMAADGDFFFANTIALTGDLVFFFGGTPVAQSFYAPQPTTQILAFNLQPDYALADGGEPQTVPFLPAFANGTTPGAVVSPLYVVTAAGNPFGGYNRNSNPNVISPEWLQASVVIAGRGSDQTSALAISTGTFKTSNSGTVYGTGYFRGVAMGADAGGLTGLSSSVATVPDANGNSLFGGSSIDGFVLDQNQATGSGNLVPGDALANQLDSRTATYGFNQPALATSLPAGVGTNRDSELLVGFFGGIMYPSRGNATALNGIALIGADTTTNQVLAVFDGTNPFALPTHGNDSTVLVFGGLSQADAGRSAFIDDSTFGAVESGTIASREDGKRLHPTRHDPTGTQLAMVSSNTVPGAIDGILPEGVTPCTCQYLQWGYWTGTLPASNGVQQFGLNTWVAGTPTINMPAHGRGSYSGAAIGTVVKQGASYMAAGGFTATYNFGNNLGTVAITNFDGANYAGVIAGTGGAAYTGGLLGVRRVGTINGAFYGPGAAETGGNFAISSISGSPYLASGIFAAKLTGTIH